MPHSVKQDDVINVSVLVVILLVIMYYSYFIAQTSARMAQLNEELATLRETFVSVSSEHERLNTKVGQLRKDTLNLEVLDEQARAVLGYIRDDERLLIYAQ